MKKLIKVVGVLAVIIVIAVGGLLVAAKILITPERVRQVVIPLAEENLKRPVSIGDVDVRLFSGIVISDFRIGEKDDARDFVSAESLVLRYQIWPLLRRSVIVDEVRLVSPSIRIERYENGAFNFDDLIAAAEAEEGEEIEPPAVPEIEPIDAEKGLPIDLLVNEITITGGKLIFTDKMVGMAHSVTDLSVKVTGLSPDRPFPFDVSAIINNAPVNVKGTVNPAEQGVTAAVRVQDLDVAAFMAYAPEDFPGRLASLKLSLDVQADATAGKLNSSGRIVVSEIDFEPSDMPDAHIENGRVSLDYGVSIDLASENIVISKADADINGIRLAASGTVMSYGSAPQLDVTARLPMIAITDILGAAPQKLVEPVLEMRPAGRISAAVHLKGAAEKPDELLEKGEITLEKVGAAIKGEPPDISGTLRIAKGTASGGKPFAFLFNGNLKINNAPVDLDGTVAPETGNVRAGVRIDGLDVVPFMAYAPENFPGKLGAMKLNVDIRTDATAEKVDTAGRISVSEIDFLPADMPDAHIVNGRVSLDYDVSIDLASENIAISKADADINGILLAASGSVMSYGNSPQLDITAHLPMIALSDMVDAAPKKLMAPVLEMRPVGRMGAQFHLKGPADKPEALVEKGEITLEAVGATINELAAVISGNIHMVKDSVRSDNLVIRLAGDALGLNFSADNLMGEVKQVRHTLTADTLDIDRLLAAVGADESEAPAPVDKSPEAPEEPGPFDIPLDVKGDVRVEKAIFKGLAVDRFDLQYTLKDNVFNVNHIRGNVAGGTIAGKAEANLGRKPLAYQVDIAVENTHAEQVISAMFPGAANTVHGNLFLNADIKGEGATWDTISRTLTSMADVNVANGRLTGTGLAGGLAGFVGTDRLEVLGFDSLRGNVKLEEGRFNLDSRLEGDSVRMSPVGSIGIDGSVNLSLDMRVSREVASGIGSRDLVSALSRTGDGWTLVPVKVAGTLWNPRFSVDTAAVKDQLMERGKEELQQQLQDRLIDRLAPQDRDKTDGEPDQKERKPLERELEDRMRRLLN